MANSGDHGRLARCGGVYGWRTHIFCSTSLEKQYSLAGTGGLTPICERFCTTNRPNLMSSGGLNNQENEVEAFVQVRHNSQKQRFALNLVHLFCSWITRYVRLGNQANAFCLFRNQLQHVGV